MPSSAKTPFTETEGDSKKNKKKGSPNLSPRFDSVWFTQHVRERLAFSCPDVIYSWQQLRLRLQSTLQFVFS